MPPSNSNGAPPPPQQPPSLRGAPDPNAEIETLLDILDEEFANAQARWTLDGRTLFCWGLMAQMRVDGAKNAADRKQHALTAAERSAAALVPLQRPNTEMLHNGHMWKRGSKVKNWKRRLFVIGDEYVCVCSSIRTEVAQTLTRIRFTADPLRTARSLARR